MLVFVLVWWIGARISNYSFVDATWALSLLIPVSLSSIFLEGDLLRKILLLAMASLWSLRLGIYLLLRILKHHPSEDPRYKKLRQIWLEKSHSRFLSLHLLNAILILLMSLPFALSMQNKGSIHWLEILGLSIFVIGFVGEMVADWQIAHFKKHSSEKICNKGLWKYSRHPNYFFEFVIWLGIWIFSCASNYPIATIHAPLILLYLLIRVTGIPPNEKAQLKSKGTAYKHYQQTTSSFIPWFKRTH